VANVWGGIEDCNESSSVLWISTGEVVRQGGEYEVDAASVVEVTRTKETGSKLILCRRSLGKCLGNRGFPRPRHPIQPVHSFVVSIRFPIFDAP
jgi:hypothetical protein